MGVTLGIPNIYLMNGYAITHEDYWAHFQAKLPELRAIAEQCGNHPRTYPVHIACGTHGALGETIQIPTLPFLAGLPVKPVRAAEAGSPGEILVILGKFSIDSEWIAPLRAYKHVIMDKVASKYNRKVIHEPIDSLNIIAPVKQDPARSPAAVASFQRLITSLHPTFPYFSDGANIGNVWVESARKLILFNLENEVNRGTLKFQERSSAVQLQPTEFRIVDL